MVVDPTSKPNYQNADYKAMSPAWTICRDILGGTAAMRAAGTAYLPEEPAELPDAYSRRKNRSVFFNAYHRTRDALVGMVFKKDPAQSDDVPMIIKTHLEDIDLAGSHIDVFAKELFTNQFQGHVFILVDMDAPLPDGSTLEDEKEAGRRPYWVKYNADQAFNWRVDKIDGEYEIIQITFEEKSREPQGKYGEQDVIRYRTFTRPLISGEYGKDSAQYGAVQWEILRLNPKTAIEEETFTLEDTGITTLTRIPVAVAYGKRSGMLTSEPPLMDLAYLNIAHWQEYSDYRNILHVVQVPILKRKGATADQQSIVIGAGSTVDVPSDGDVEWVEIQAHGIKAGREELIDLEQRMAVMGLAILSSRQDTYITATAKRQDWEERQSDLATMARSLQDAMELALDYHAEYLGLPTGGSIDLGVSEEQLTIKADYATLLLTAVEKRALSLETFLNILARAAILPDDVTIEEEIQRILDDIKRFGPAAPTSPPNQPGQPPAQEPPGTPSTNSAGATP